MSCRTSVYAFAGLLAALGLGGCTKPTTGPDPATPGSPAPAGPYFDVRRLLDGQVQLLAARHLGVIKQASLHGDAPEEVNIPNAKWADELQIFYQADINKAALRGAYALDSTTGPDGSIRRIYTLRPGHPKVPVLQLAVVSSDRWPQTLTAHIRQDNALFYGAKDLSLNFENGQLRRYEVSGVQKLVLFDSLRYRSAAKIL